MKAKKVLVFAVITAATLMLANVALAGDTTDMDPLDAEDMCPGTIPDEKTPRLVTNKWKWNGFEWVTRLPKSGTNGHSYTILQTRGCSCAQVLEWLARCYPEEFGEMEGQWKWGCSVGTMDAFVERSPYCPTWTPPAA